MCIFFTRVRVHTRTCRVPYPVHAIDELAWFGHVAFVWMGTVASVYDIDGPAGRQCAVSRLRLNTFWCTCSWLLWDVVALPRWHCTICTPLSKKKKTNNVHQPKHNFHHPFDWLIDPCNHSTPFPAFTFSFSYSCVSCVYLPSFFEEVKQYIFTHT